MNSVLVTGSQGFLGKALVNRLNHEGHHVIALDRSWGDIYAPETFQHLPAVDMVYHLAARSFIPDSWQCTTDFIKTNVLGTQNVLEYCLRHRARLVFASAYVYGIPKRLPINENHPVNPNNPYAASKYLAEQLCTFYAQYRGIQATTLRIFNIYGPAQKSDFLIPTIVVQALTGDRICLKSLAPRRDYVFIEDVVDALIRAGERTAGFKLYNIGSGRSHSVAELVAAVQVAAGTSLPVSEEGKQRAHEIPDVVADCDLAREALGWTPRYSLEDGLKAVVMAARETY